MNQNQGLPHVRRHAPREWAYERPYLFAILLTLLQVGLGIIVLGVAPALLPGWDPIKLRVVATAVMAVVAAGLLQAFHMWRDAGFNGLKDWRHNGEALLVLLLTLAPLGFGFKMPPVSEAATMTWGMIVNSFAEEAIFRGLAFAVLLPRGAIKAVVITSVLFGVLHFLRLLFGADLIPTVLQVSFAIFFGLLVGAMRLRNATIWWPIIIHTVSNLFSTFSSAKFTETQEIVLTIGNAVLSLLITAYMLWRHQVEQRSTQ